MFGEGAKAQIFGKSTHMTRERLDRFCSDFARSLCSMHPKKRRVAGLWSRDQMLCECGADDILSIHPVRLPIPASGGFLLLLLNLGLVLYVVYNKCSCHGASPIQIRKLVTNSVGDSRCHRAILRTTDTVRIRIAVNDI